MAMSTGFDLTTALGPGTEDGLFFFLRAGATVGVASGLVVSSSLRGFEEPSPVMNSSTVLRRSESLT